MGESREAWFISKRIGAAKKKSLEPREGALLRKSLPMQLRRKNCVVRERADESATAAWKLRGNLAVESGNLLGVEI